MVLQGEKAGDVKDAAMAKGLLYYYSIIPSFLIDIHSADNF